MTKSTQGTIHRQTKKSKTQQSQIPLWMQQCFFGEIISRYGVELNPQTMHTYRNASAKTYEGVLIIPRHNELPGKIMTSSITDM